MRDGIDGAGRKREELSRYGIDMLTQAEHRNRALYWGIASEMKTYAKTKYGQIVLGDSLEYMTSLESESVDLIVTSPPFGLVRKKDYGNVESHEYVDWFKPFGHEFKRILKPTGSLVIDIGGV